MSEYTRYGVSDIVVKSEVKLAKYVEVKDINGNVLDSVEVYFIEEEDDEWYYTTVYWCRPKRNFG